MKTTSSFLLIGIFILTTMSCSVHKADMANAHSEMVHAKHNGQFTHCSLCMAATHMQPAASKVHDFIPLTPKTCQLGLHQNNGVLKPLNAYDAISNRPIKQALTHKHATTPKSVHTNNGHAMVKTQAKPTHSNLKNTAKPADGQPKVEGLGLAGFILGIVGLFMPLGIGIIMCILAIIFGAVSLGKIKKNPEKYRGRGFALTSLIIGIVGIGFVLLLAALLA